MKIDFGMDKILLSYLISKSSLGRLKKAEEMDGKFILMRGLKVSF
jgi:hypothetical protein